MSIVPNFSTVSLTTFFQSSSDATSSFKPTAVPSPKSALILSTTAASLSSDLPVVAITFAPSLAKRYASAAPCPYDAPVMITILFFTLSIFILPFVRKSHNTDRGSKLT